MKPYVIALGVGAAFIAAGCLMLFALGSDFILNTVGMFLLWTGAVLAICGIIVYRYPRAFRYNYW